MDCGLKWKSKASRDIIIKMLDVQLKSCWLSVTTTRCQSNGSNNNGNFKIALKDRSQWENNLDYDNVMIIIRCRFSVRWKQSLFLSLWRCWIIHLVELFLILQAGHPAPSHRFQRNREAFWSFHSIVSASISFSLILYSDNGSLLENRSEASCCALFVFYSRFSWHDER